MMSSVKETALGPLASQQRRRKGTVWTKVWVGALVLLSGLLLNQIPWYHSLGAWADLLLPIAAFFIAVTGAAWFVIGFLHHSSERELCEWNSLPLNIAPAESPQMATPRKPRRLFFPLSLVSVPLTVIFGVFYLTMQFIQTGADRVGQCRGLDEAAATTGLIPQSVVFPPRPAVSCGNERYGMFLSLYNDVTVYGVTNPAAQDRILLSLSDYRKQEHTLPTRVSFYEKEVWTEHPGKNGASWGKRGPEKLIRVAIAN